MLKKEDFYGTKTLFSSEEKCQEAQQILLDLGFSWCGNGTTFDKNGYSTLNGSPIKPCTSILIVYRDMSIYTLSDEDSFREHGSREIPENMYQVDEETEQLRAELLKELEMPKKETKKEEMSLKKKFVYVDDAIEALETAFETGENIILYGKGGHAKSELTAEFFKEKGIEPFVKTMGSGTTTDQLFGGIDIKKFEEHGVIDYLVENSFMNQEYVVFEELLDAPDYILENLKDILTSKKFRNGNQTIPIKTKLIVCCTNKTREEFAKNDSLLALMERFPLTVKVEWPNYTKTSYNYMFKTCLGTDYPELEYILEKLAEAGTIVSPRTAIKAANIIDKRGFEAIRFIADFSDKNATLVRNEREKFKNISVIMELRTKLSEMTDLVAKQTIDSIDGIKDCKTLIKKVEILKSQLKSKKADDEIMNENLKILTKAERTIKDRHQQMEKLLNDNED